MHRKILSVARKLEKASKAHAGQAKLLKSIASHGKKRAKSGGKICPEGKAWARRTFDTYPSAYANMAASKYCKNPNYAKKAKGGKRKGR